MCTLTFQFTPSVALTGTETIASLNGTASVTTNSLNGNDVVNSVSLSGIETKPLPELSLAASSTQIYYGQPITLTATVAGGVGEATTAPTGQADFYVGSTSLGAVTLTSTGETSTASLTVAAGQLPAGSGAITFHYTGDTVYKGVTSSALTVNVAQDSTTAALSLSPAVITPASTVTLTASIANSNSALVPSGTVSFNYVGALAPNGAVLNTATLSNGVASIRQLLPPGEGAITVTYSGNANFAGSTSSFTGVNVVKLTPTVTLSAPTGNVSIGSSIFVKAIVASPANGYQPSGTITIFANGQGVGSCTLASAFCMLSISSLTSGSQSLYAVYSGDTSFNSASSAISNFTVVAATPKISVSFSSTSAAYGAPVSITASVATTDGTTPATGTIIFLIDGVASGSPVALNAGSATLTPSGIGAGYYHVQAVYSGDANYAQGSSGLSYLTISKLTPTVSLASSSPFSSVTSPASVTATVAGTYGTPTGTVIFYSGTTRVGSATLAGGTATITPALAAGNYNLTAAYSGDSNFVAANTAGALQLNVGQAQIGINVSASSTSVAVGQSVSIKVALQNYNSAFPPTGTVLLFDNGPSLATLNVVNGVASGSFLLPLGSNGIEAIYEGSVNYRGINSNPIYIQVNQATTTLTFSETPNPDVFGDLFTVNAKVSTSASGVSPSGTVTFFYGGNAIGTGTVAAGMATFATNALPVGTAALTAQYSGDSNFLSSSSGTLNLAVNKAKPTLTLTPSATSVTKGSSVTLTVTAAALTVAGNTVYPTGNVTFYNGNTNVGTATFTGGTATLTISTLPVGTNAVHASCSGDGNFTSANASSVNIAVTAAQP